MAPLRVQLQVHTNPKQNRIEWKIQKAFWSLATLVLAGALFGVFGNSSLTKVSLNLRDAELEYEKFLRLSAPTEIKYEIKGSEKRGETALISIFMSEEIFDRMELEGVVPQPEKVLLVREGLNFVFHSEPEANRTRVVFYLKPLKPGRLRARIGTVGEETVAINQFIYP